MDKYNWLQLIGVAPLFSPTAMVLEAGGLSWLVEELFPDRVSQTRRMIDEDLVPDGVIHSDRVLAVCGKRRGACDARDPEGLG
jgi:hypothetical protein